MGSLELREEPGGLRHYLDGRPVHSGDLIELHLHPAAAVDTNGDFLRDVWIAGRYEWTCLKDDLPQFVIVAADGTKMTWPLQASVSYRWSRRFPKDP